MTPTRTYRTPLLLAVLAALVLAFWVLSQALAPGLQMGDFGPPLHDGMFDSVIDGQAFTGSFGPRWLGDLPGLLLAGGVAAVTLLAVAAVVLLLVLALPMALLAGLALVAGLVLLPVLGLVLAAVGGPLLAGLLVLGLLLLPLLLLGKLLAKLLGWLLR